MRKSDVITAVILMTRASDLGWLSGQKQRINASALATALMAADRDAKILARLHLDECNGDHEKCRACDGTGSRPTIGRQTVNCQMCKGTGRKTAEEIDKLARKRDRLEVQIVHRLQSVGILATIERDPRGGPVRLYTDDAYLRRDEPFVVLPMGGR